MGVAVSSLGSAVSSLGSAVLILELEDVEVDVPLSPPPPSALPINATTITKTIQNHILL